MRTDLLYLGDCLDVLDTRVEEASVDLVYLDPPFNSDTVQRGRSRADDGAADGPEAVFDDRWRWGDASAAELARARGTEARRALDALDSLGGPGGTQAS